jgi:hypothetical protein
MRLGAWILMALCVVSTAHAEDWLDGEYDVVVPHRPVPKRVLLVVTRDVEGRYRDEVFEEPVDASTEGSPRRAMPHAPGTDAGVRVPTAGEMASAEWPELAAANVRCASVEGMLPCLVPEGAAVKLGDRTLKAGCFGSGMHVGLIDVHKRPSRVGAHATPLRRPGDR